MPPPGNFAYQGPRKMPFQNIVNDHAAVGQEYRKRFGGPFYPPTAPAMLVCSYCLRTYDKSQAEEHTYARCCS